MENLKSLISPTILELKKKLKKGNQSALDEFWLKIESRGTPLIEQIKNDEKFKLVTFIIRADKETKNAVVVCSIADQDDVVSNNICERVENTNVLYKSFMVLNGTRTIYTISKNNSLTYKRFYDNLMHNWDTLSPDPFNPKKFIQRYRREGKAFIVEYSILELPNAEPQKWNNPNMEVIPGNLKSIDFTSRILKTIKQIWVYTPSNFNIDAGPYHFLIIFDGKAFIEFTQAPTIFDNLQAESKIPPAVAVFIHNYSGFNRSKDLSCYPPFADFIAKELVPWAREVYNVSSNPAHSILIGSSSGGLIS
jgi:enterochelin esterase family protein